MIVCYEAITEKRENDRVIYEINRTTMTWSDIQYFRMAPKPHNYLPICWQDKAADPHIQKGKHETKPTS